MGRFSVFGLGYVGSTMVAGLSSQGHHVIGSDPSETKRRMIELGQSPVGEPGLSEIIDAGRRQGLIRVTRDPAEALREGPAAFICVGTPSSPGGGIDLRVLAGATREIAAAIAESGSKVSLIYRSTVVPGTIEEAVLPELERRAPGGEGPRYEVAYYPEFMREGSGLEDYLHPPKIVVGSRTAGIREILAQTFPVAPSPVFWTDFRTAEFCKYMDNAFHAAKITFANEIGILAKASGVDTSTLVRIFLSDRKLNISEAYLRPGFAFGGSCLPKDLRAILASAASRGLSLPLLSGILSSNEAQIARVRSVIIEKAGGGPVGFIGLVFKPGTDDLRESPFLRLAAETAARGLRVLCHDPDIRMDRLTGANRDHAEEVFPGLSQALAPDAEEVWSSSRLVVLGRSSEAGTELMVRAFAKAGGFLVDLTATGRMREWCPGAYWGVV